MATKIRLQRQGRKGRPIFHVVVADSRAPRDGRYIERLGIYNPNTNPATIDINFDKTLDWLQKGAELTDTSRAILSYRGVLHKHHLLNGVKKGALTPEQVEDKFNQWLEAKESKITSKIDSITGSKESKAKANLERESKLKEAKAAKVLLKNSELANEVAIENEVTEENIVVEGNIESTEVVTNNIEDNTEVVDVNETAVEESSEPETVTISEVETQDTSSETDSENTPAE